MKRNNLFLFFMLLSCQSFSQKNNYDLPNEFKDVAVRAFQKVSSLSKQWFVDAARQLPTGPIDTAWARKKLKEKFTDNDISSFRELFIVMMEYQRMVNQETKTDQRIIAENKQKTLTTKEDKLKIDNKKIDQQVQEAQEKEENQMSAVQVELWTGIVNNHLGAGNFANANDQKTPPVKINPITLRLNDSSKAKKKNSDKTQQLADKMQNQAENDDEAKKQSEDHKKDTKDAINKLLGQMSEMNKHKPPW